MDIRFPITQVTVAAIEKQVADLRNKGELEEIQGNERVFRYVQPSEYSLETVNDLEEQGVQFVGYNAFLRMTFTEYDTGTVTPGVRGATREEENPTPPPDTITVAQFWKLWQTGVARIKNDNSEVIITIPYAPTNEELVLFDSDSNVLEVMGTDIVLGVYDNDVDWVLDELGFPVVDPPVEKNASYWTENWETDGSAFDFLHAQRLVNTWFQALPGANITDKFNTQSGAEKQEIIRWGVLGDTTEAKDLVEARIVNKSKREFLRRWHIDRLVQAREKRFRDTWSFLVDNFKNNAIVTRLETMLDPVLKDFYILQGESNQAQHLIVNGEINDTFWIQFAASDVAYTDRDLDELKARSERILNGNRY